MDIKEIFLGVLICGGVILIMGYISTIILPEQMNQQITAIECCNNQICSDTYYTYPDNKCHLSLCENSLIPQSNCTYQGLNKSIDLIN